ncbi:deoxynucleoside kinase [Persicobacter psychrovividus]|uniref:Deoxynucleoside kinase n=1 Tax=Persicobacter psychrovividus TaxID=387638 RepID=A0ABM7VDP2_9BACT|nr:deoxynucleoside kinase [Persicobacter psychrovividus]
MHIAVTGNIGSGKTTLSTKLAQHYGWVAEFESVADNPYLSDFYEDMPRWAFHLELYFLKSRFKQAVGIKEREETTVQDRTIDEGVNIFAKNLKDTNVLSDRDWDNYLALYGHMKNFISSPDLIIYLRANTPKLVKQIQKRGRDYEQTIPIKYLEDLNHHYEAWISQITGSKVLIFDVNEMDFEHVAEDFATITEAIDRELFGLFS